VPQGITMKLRFCRLLLNCETGTIAAGNDEKISEKQGIK
jgi:hypothetical protein